jgi:hypothetical protein
MIRTEWLNTSVEDLRGTLALMSDAELFKRRADILDTMVEATGRHHSSRVFVLMGKLRERHACTQCGATVISLRAPRRACRSCGCRAPNHWRPA